MPGRNRRHHDTPSETTPPAAPLPSSPSPGGGECDGRGGQGVRGSGEAGSSAVTSPAAATVRNVLPFPPSPAPRGRVGEGARLTWTAR
jgi:hypothetical protein